MDHVPVARKRLASYAELVPAATHPQVKPKVIKNQNINVSSSKPAKVTKAVVAKDARQKSSVLKAIERSRRIIDEQERKRSIPLKENSPVVGNLAHPPSMHRVESHPALGSVTKTSGSDEQMSMAEEALHALSTTLDLSSHAVSLNKPASKTKQKKAKPKESIAQSALQALSASLGLDLVTTLHPPKEDLEPGEIIDKRAKKRQEKLAKSAKYREAALAKKKALLEGKQKAVTVQATPKVICKYWMEGKCMKGEQCTFSHASTPTKTVLDARINEPCKYFISGSCMRGDICLYSHDLKKFPCKFFHGIDSCSMGDQCKYSHDPVADEVKAELMLQMLRRRSPPMNENP